MFVNYKEMGKRIAKKRKSLGLTQAEVIERIDINENYLSHIETARTTPSIDVLMKICTALDTNPDYFLLGILKGNENKIENIKQKISLVPEKSYNLLSGFLDLLIEINEEV